MAGFGALIMAVVFSALVSRYRIIGSPSEVAFAIGAAAGPLLVLGESSSCEGGLQSRNDENAGSMDVAAFAAPRGNAIIEISIIITS
jgi:hypothetical protein